MTERVVETLCAEDVPVRSLPGILVKAWPDAAVLDLVLAIATGCDAVESMFGKEGVSGARAREGWQVAALLATDLRAMQAIGVAHGRAWDLLAYWQAHDPYFLTD